MQITMEGKYRTRDGRGVRILCLDGPNLSYPIVGFIVGELDTSAWTDAGFVMRTQETDKDLVPVLTKHGGWAAVSVSRHWIGTAYENYVDALADALQQTREHDPPAYSVTRVYALDSVPIPVPTKHEGWMALHICNTPESLPVGPVYVTKESAAARRDRNHTIDNLGGFPTRRMIIAHVTWED